MGAYLEIIYQAKSLIIIAIGFVVTLSCGGNPIRFQSIADLVQVSDPYSGRVATQYMIRVPH